MGFRRSKQTALEARNWRRFLEANRESLDQAGIPGTIYEFRERFDDLLMHGCLDHHPDATRFTTDELDERQRALLIEIIVRYLRAGFGNPGLGIFGSDIHNQILRRAAGPG
ncbi:MAG TPA: hypothetical protein VGX68_19385 [Thermoanaerobaculia bacterium]|jgi:hypothetical protein|nr:hypothetical protein [Thermoanaerobaculia bacterium]